jgi:hypothetical protein
MKILGYVIWRNGHAPTVVTRGRAAIAPLRMADRPR